MNLHTSLCGAQSFCVGEDSNSVEVGVNIMIIRRPCMQKLQLVATLLTHTNYNNNNGTIVTNRMRMKIYTHGHTYTSKARS